MTAKDSRAACTARSSQMFYRGYGHPIPRPVYRQGLLADGLIELIEAEWGEAFAGTSVVVTFPSDRDSARRGRDLEPENAAFRMLEFVDISKGNARFCRRRNLHLERCNLSVYERWFVPTIQRVLLSTPNTRQVLSRPCKLASFASAEK